MRQLFLLRTHLEYTLKLVNLQRLELRTIAEGHPLIQWAPVKSERTYLYLTSLGSWSSAQAPGSI